jgi:hypothetical protein
MIDKLALKFAQELKARNNPSSYKELTIATVSKVEPLLLTVSNSQIQLSEEIGNLYIPEWFQFRCDIDKTQTLSSSVPSDTDNAEAVAETHSYTGAGCQMPNAISYLASAILGVRDELLALKCELKVGDKVIVSPLESDSEYVIVDKVYSKKDGE